MRPSQGNPSEAPLPQSLGGFSGQLLSVAFGGDVSARGPSAGDRRPKGGGSVLDRGGGRDICAEEDPPGRRRPHRGQSAWLVDPAPPSSWVKPNTPPLPLPVFLWLPASRSALEIYRSRHTIRDDGDQVPGRKWHLRRRWEGDFLALRAPPPKKKPCPPPAPHPRPAQISRDLPAGSWQP